MAGHDLKHGLVNVFVQVELLSRLGADGLECKALLS